MATLARSILELQQVGYVFRRPGQRPLRALTEVSLVVKAGAFVSILGPSGCGKSTLIRLAGGLLRPTEGTVRLLGEDPEKARGPSPVGLVFQEPALLPWRTTLLNVTLPAEIAGVDKDVRMQRASALLGMLGMENFAASLPNQLSGGMKQRTSIARALMLEPELLLLDEPFGALDQITRERLQLELSFTWQKTATAGLLVTHDIDEAVFMSDAVVVLARRPGAVAGTVEVPAPRPRSDSFRSSTVFFELCCSVRALLKQAAEMTIAPRAGDR